jgi:tRNA pseudouridine-54 N-methylase
MASTPPSLFFYFNDTPLHARVPLKAMTSQGRRFDVACRMIRAALFRDGKFLPTAVSCWFSGDPAIPPVRVDLCGQDLETNQEEGRFRSELAVARLLVAAMQDATGSGMEARSGGIVVTTFPAGENPVTDFMATIDRARTTEGRITVLLHESGSPLLSMDEDGNVATELDANNPLAIIVGNHKGFPEEIEQKLLDTCDHVACIRISRPGDVEQVPVSYLGSHVIEMMLGTCWLSEDFE